MTDKRENVWGAARAEAYWLVQQVAMGKMSLPEAVELVTISDHVLATWARSAERDDELFVIFANAGLFRLLVALELLKLLGQPAQPHRDIRTIRRSGRRPVRLSLGPAETECFQ